MTDVNGNFSILLKGIASFISAAETSDPIGTTLYQPNVNDQLDNIFALTRFNVRNGQIVVGTDADRTVLSILPSSIISSSLPTGAVQSAEALHIVPTTTSVRNVIVVVGENQTFDAVFGAYRPPSGQTMKNLLSQGTINANGTPGPNINLVVQNFKYCAEHSQHQSDPFDSLRDTTVSDRHRRSVGGLQQRHDDCAEIEPSRPHLVL